MLMFWSTATSGVLQLDKELINVHKATMCWTWINRFSMISKEAGIGVFFASVGKATTADVLLQQPVFDISAAAIGHKPLAEPLPLKASEATAARQSGENGTPAMPEHLLGVASGNLHTSSTVSVCMPAVCVDCRVCADHDCFRFQLHLSQWHKADFVQGVYAAKHGFVSVHIFCQTQCDPLLCCSLCMQKLQLYLHRNWNSICTCHGSFQSG